MERIKREWTLEQVGKEINKNHNAVWHYENGSRTIDVNFTPFIPKKQSCPS